MVFEIAAVGLEKKDIELYVEDGNCLKVAYVKPNIDANNSDIDAGEYIHKGIAKRSFNLGWKIDSKFDLSKAKAEFVDGLLTVTIPFAKGSELKTLKIS